MPDIPTLPTDDFFDLVIRKLNRLACLDEGDVAQLRALPHRIENVRTGSYLVRQGDTVEACCILVNGYACRNKLTQDGHRQILSFHLPGDILDLQHLLMGTADHNIQAITDATVAWVPVTAMRMVATRVNIGAAMWRDTLIDASIFREWLLNVGQRDARTRVAHMLCEFATRRAAAGLGQPESFELPMTQEHIADATGMTSIHVNRMLSALGVEGVISRDKRKVEIADWERMRRIADFDPSYLHAIA